VCWGQDDEGQATPKSGDSRSVSAGGYHACGVKFSGDVVCWGYDSYAQVSDTPTSGNFRSVSASSEFSCGVKANDKVVCWGADDANQVSDTPDDKFRSVDAATY
jgi:alpha-tubulin suppressor-like RCC1 family protein